MIGWAKKDRFMKKKFLCPVQICSKHCSPFKISYRIFRSILSKKERVRARMNSIWGGKGEGVREEKRGGVTRQLTLFLSSSSCFCSLSFSPWSHEQCWCRSPSSRSWFATRSFASQISWPVPRCSSSSQVTLSRAACSSVSSCFICRLKFSD